MSLIARLYDFAPGAVIRSQEFDDEFNQIVNMLSGVSQDKSIRVRNNNASFAAARFDQLAANDILELFASGVEVGRIEQSGKFKSLVATGTAPIDVDSITVCPNLNADLLDGFDSLKFDRTITTPQFATIGNVGVGEDDLHSHTIAANTLNSNGEHIVADFSGSFANNANSKNLRIRFGGAQIYTASSASFQNIDWHLRIVIIRDGANSVRTSVSGNWQSNVVNTLVQAGSAAGLSFAGSLILKATAEAVADNDITQKISIVKKGGV